MRLEHVGTSTGVLAALALWAVLLWLLALGGLGNNRGAIIGGLALGLFQQAANFLVGGIFSSVAVFTLFIVVLLAAPQGLFGSSTARRV